MAPAKGEGLAVVTREVWVRVLNLSEGGCLVESDHPMAVGTFGRLRLRLGMKEYMDDIEVVRCQQAEDDHVGFRIGLRFVWPMPGQERSIRHAVDSHVAEMYAAVEDARLM